MSVESDFNNITTSVIEQYLQDKQEETLHLEFKTVASDKLKKPDDKKNFAKALSGFSNSDGGMVVWGVDARKNKDGVDCVVAIPGLENPKIFLSRLLETTGEYASPLIDGVEHKVIGKFVVSLVPRSDSGPHMAKAGENRYFKRNGDSFYCMEHFDLEDLFGRRPKPKLCLAIRSTGSEFILSIENIGRGSARAPYIAFDVDRPWQRSTYGLDGNHNQGLMVLTVGANPHYPYVHSDGNVTIHPGTILDVTEISTANSYRGEIPNVLSIRYQIVCEGMASYENSQTCKLRL